MTDPLLTLQETFWVNIWPPKSDNGPILTIALKDKKSGELFRYPVWRDKKDPEKMYLGKLDVYQPKTDYKTTPEVSGKIDRMEDDIPF